LTKNHQLIAQMQNLDFSRLKGTTPGGTALVKATAERRWKALIDYSVLEGYCVTETSPVASTNPCGDKDRLGTVGVPVPGTAFKVIDDAGVEQGLGGRGELCVKGP
jgi:long-chain acyl-CoA synthetase